MNSDLNLRLAQSIDACLDYILALQSSDGSWTDWDLPPGKSSVWTTGYVGFKLQYLAEHWMQKATAARLAASDWLLRNRFADCGWGYNEAVGSDADSTAFAVLCVASAGLQVPASTYDHFERYQCSDGGFSTYCSDGPRNSWTASHSDVTPVVLRALLVKYPIDEPVVSNGVEYVVRQKTVEGLWNSFWWDSHLYGTEASFSLLEAVNVRFDTSATEHALCQHHPSKAFEVALLISSLLYVNSPGTRKTAAKLVEQLIRQQEPGGSWKSDPILRITRRDCFEPWNSSNAGPLFRDTQKLFTSSTVLAALSRAYLEDL